MNRPVPSNRPSRDERGLATLEAVVVVPAFLLMIGLLILGGRTAVAQQAVQVAAADAARAASIARTASAAHADATRAAQQSLANQQQDCATTTITVDAAAFATEVGSHGEVSATVSCGLRLDDLGLPLVSGVRTLTATMSSPLDAYRER